ncbi:MAG: adenylate/guanylate cyclase domain-containing protein [Planctomycetota bacterium]|nr:adenylate/guanylate cyclase domain-containing protein [Planctomycetota bacterium]
MAEQRVQRRLAAIFAADVVGYSRLMGEDETGTLTALKQHRAALIDPTIAEHRGRIVKLMGDGLLVEFASVVDAVECAVTVQRAMVGRNANIPDTRRITFRIGVNLGDIIIDDDDDIYGDGVNVAARLEGLAEPGGICISGTVFDQVKGKLDLSFYDLGPQEVKNIAEPVRVFRVSDVASPNAAETVTAAIFENPTIAVLPFQNMSGDPEQEYFADGLMEDLITALSLWRSFPVISRSSTFVYKSQSVDIQKVGKELGARYVLEGSVRKAGNRIRVTGQLIDADTGHHVWAERFERPMDDMFDLQDELARRIAATVVPEVEHAESKQSVQKPPRNLGAWEFYVRGITTLCEPSGNGTSLAREMFGKAVELDPDYAKAHAGIAFSHGLDLVLNQTKSRMASVESLVESARVAAMLDRTDSMSQLMMSMAYGWTHQDDLCIAAAEKSIDLNPSNAVAYGHLGTMLDVIGHHDKGIASLEQCLRLSPKEPLAAYIHMTFLARAHLTARRYEEAIAWAHKTLAQHAPYPPATYIIGVALAHLGQMSEALKAFDDCEREQTGFIKRRTEWRPYRDQAENEHILEGLRKSGWGS